MQSRRTRVPLHADPQSGFVAEDLGHGERVLDVVVIECTGHATTALELTSPGGLLGLLGTPRDSEGLPAEAVHRAGVTVAGMHELAGYDAIRYQDTFTTVLEWVTLAVGGRQARSWCRRIPGEEAPGLYARLQGAGRPPEPFLILNWSTP